MLRKMRFAGREGNEDGSLSRHFLTVPRFGEC
jgi:hypothetical protein